MKLLTINIVILPLILMLMTACTSVKKEFEAVPESIVSTAVEVKSLAALPEEIKEKTVKIMTYNIRHGVGVDNNYDLDRIISVIKEADPDIVSLNEVDHMMPRTYMQKQDKIIADALGYNLVYGFNINFGSKYGNVLLSKHPITTYINDALPKNKMSEPRGLIQADVNIDDKTIKVLSTHLSINSEERPEQIVYIIEKLKELDGPTVLIGDFNAAPSSNEVKQISEMMEDSAKEEYGTFPANDPTFRIDYIFVSEELEVKNNKVIESEASDHLPVLAEVSLKEY
ncbi:endonuclease/exonuclease/phosphatase family protein [Petroclostridium sp. X23]|uniref:endonuclease/exonuclease/phosphatase family protein n=1 Tax=Petroclostridium sp. X23 TaxID=3045146 RepID=UPI0024AD8F3B|nr:endonuclease/exonuclease/phosphatase family protein [Petroclostridium sp. X23]WHH57317.1 endonuclease/exonuclease/phosphatase family protein [Petroclostridium sp. X23]